MAAAAPAAAAHRMEGRCAGATESCRAPKHLTPKPSLIENPMRSSTAASAQEEPGGQEVEPEEKDLPRHHGGRQAAVAQDFWETSLVAAELSGGSSPGLSCRAFPPGGSHGYQTAQYMLLVVSVCCRAEA